MLYEMLRQNLIKLNVDAGTKEEAVRAVGQLMLDGGYIKPAYINAMCEMAEDAAGYIVITKGVAMPHARPEYGVNRICAAIITLKEPIPFGNPVNDPVKMVIALAATDHISHLELMQDIAAVLDDEELVEQLKQGRSETELTELIKTKLDKGEALYV